MKIAFLTHHDPHDRRAWSGTLFYVLRTLEEHCGEVVSLGPMGPGWSFTRVGVRRAVWTLFRQNADDLHLITPPRRGRPPSKDVWQNMRLTLFLLRLPQPRLPS
jgi:hypothetical protein